VTLPTILAAVHAAGGRLRLVGDRLRVEAPSPLDAELLGSLRAHAPEIRWRAMVMSRQVTPGGPLPLLLARPVIRFPPGSCCSCGDPLDGHHRYRCELCAVAVVAVLENPG
jgi:hypothetical protein